MAGNYREERKRTNTCSIVDHGLTTDQPKREAKTELTAFRKLCSRKSGRIV
jgi:hypothetical protein